MTRSAGQQQALEEIRAIEAGVPGALELISVQEPTEDDSRMVLNVSLDCAGMERAPGGIRLHGRERLRLHVPVGFPHKKPDVWSRHHRWAGTPHVQWSNYLCLYQAPATEWQPADGMFGFMDRLVLWLERAALGQLDPVGGPIHPPVAYVGDDPTMVIPRVDTPKVGAKPWSGWAATTRVSDRRVDLGAWTADRDPQGAWQAPPEGAAAAFLLPGVMDWEYPRHAATLLVGLVDRGIGFGDLLDHLRITTLALPVGSSMLVVVGSAMRGTQGGAARQHLACWRLPAEVVDDLRRSLVRLASGEELQAFGERAHNRAFQWLRDAQVEWCIVREDRPEIVTRRDEGAPIRALAGRRVAVWGCGALGAPIAHALARAGVEHLMLVDSGAVTPGILVRQPFADADIGQLKAHVVAAQVRAIRPELTVEPLARDLVRLLDEDGWHGGCNLIIDASANGSVRSKLEQIRRLGGDLPEIACMMVGHQAEHGMAVLARPEHSGGPDDVLRSIKLDCLRRRELRGFAHEFWPATARTEHFQPEPGCSDATFRGSAAETGALSMLMLGWLARQLAAPASEHSAYGQLLALPGVEHPGAGSCELAYKPARVSAVDGRTYEVRLTPAALSELRGAIADGARRLGAGSETGGLIFGERDRASGVLWVHRLTGPPTGSLESPQEFVCGTEGVPELVEGLARYGRGSLEYLGMWHTHPDGRSNPSPRDLEGMGQLSLVAGGLTHGLILIVGHARALTEASVGPKADVSPYLFDGQVGTTHLKMTITRTAPVTVPDLPSAPDRDIGLALSGGGSRAIAFHLGCLRALHDRGLLERVRVVSGVSGGSVLTALWAYSADDFEQFERRVLDVLTSGLQRSLARRALLPPRLLQAAGTRLIAGSAAGAARAGALVSRRLGRELSGDPPLRRWSSRTDAFEDILRQRLFSEQQMAQVARAGVDVVINACDLLTGGAFRFGSKESGSAHLGRVVGKQLSVAEAVTASAAYPLLLPALDRQMSFEPLQGGERFEKRVVLTDGGVFDNLGTSCLVPGRDQRFSTNVHPDVAYIIACDAGRGQLAPFVPWSSVTRVQRSFSATYRKAQDATRSSLHALVEHGELRGFAMPYLGQQDARLPQPPADLIRRDEVVDYPTNFAAMKPEDVRRLSRRGEQLTRLMIERWCPEL